MKNTSSSEIKMWSVAFNAKSGPGWKMDLSVRSAMRRGVMNVQSVHRTKILFLALSARISLRVIVINASQKERLNAASAVVQIAGIPAAADMLTVVKSVMRPYVRAAGPITNVRVRVVMRTDSTSFWFGCCPASLAVPAGDEIIWLSLFVKGLWFCCFWKKNKMKPTNRNADTYVEGERQYLSQFLQDTVGHPDMMYSFHTLVGHSCLTLLGTTLARHFYLTRLFNTLVGHSHLTLL